LCPVAEVSCRRVRTAGSAAKEAPRSPAGHHRSRADPVVRGGSYRHRPARSLCRQTDSPPRGGRARKAIAGRVGAGRLLAVECDRPAASTGVTPSGGKRSRDGGSSVDRPCLCSVADRLSACRFSVSGKRGRRDGASAAPSTRAASAAPSTRAPQRRFAARSLAEPYVRRCSASARRPRRPSLPACNTPATRLTRPLRSGPVISLPDADFEALAPQRGRPGCGACFWRRAGLRALRVGGPAFAARRVRGTRAGAGRDVVPLHQKGQRDERADSRLLSACAGRSGRSGRRPAPESPKGLERRTGET
jgi:hypothetical protein